MLLTFQFGMSYSDGMESKGLTEAKVMAKLTEWVNNMRGLLECPDFKGAICLELHINVAKAERTIHQYIKP